jgi:hypothetical protein
MKHGMTKGFYIFLSYRVAPSAVSSVFTQEAHIKHCEAQG